jgi:glycosyltransferase involved in cell wall biosynthesis
MVEVKVSLITISYNSSQSIEATIQSVLAQDYKNIEYIIIDGKSTDGTMDIVNKYKDRINWRVYFRRSRDDK